METLTLGILILSIKFRLTGASFIPSSFYEILLKVIKEQVWETHEGIIWRECFSWACHMHLIFPSTSSAVDPGLCLHVPNWPLLHPPATDLRKTNCEVADLYLLCWHHLSWMCYSFFALRICSILGLGLGFFLVWYQDSGDIVTYRTVVLKPFSIRTHFLEWQLSGT